MNMKATDCRESIFKCARNCNLELLKELKLFYSHCLNFYPFPLKDEKFSPQEYILFLKREKFCIGPYQNISVFEAANRIGTDLVLINGILQIVSEGKIGENDKFTLRLGNEKENGKGDFTINNELEGEAFNVSKSFYSSKMSCTKKKWRMLKKKLSYILVNEESAPKFIKDNTIIKVRNWADLG